MFEQGFSFLLSRFLGEFVHDGNFNKENVQVGIWSGYIVLENLVLKRKIVDSLELPVNLVHGMIGRLELKIPWANLGSEPVVVILDRVHIVVEPKYEWDTEARKRREKNIKQAKLAGAELFATRRLVEGESENYTNMAQKWLLERLISQLVDNLQVTIRDVHIRFEDHLSCSKPFSAGVTFECLHAFSKEEGARQAQPPQKGSDGRPAPTRSGAYQKLIRMEQLAVYWNPVLPSSIHPYYTQFIGRSAAEIEVLMTRTVSRRSRLHAEGPRHHYILHPVDFDTHLVVERDPVTSQPQPQVTVTIDNLKMSIEDRQFREYLILMSNFDSFQQLEKHSALRPQVSVHENPSAWWRYAIQVVLEENRAKRSTWSWVTLHQRSKDRLVYIELWKRKLVGHSRDGTGTEPTFEQVYQASAQRRAERVNTKYPALAPATIDMLEALEEKLTFEDIILFRSMAEKDLSEVQQSQKSWLGGWASFLMGGWYGGVSEEEKHKLFEALRYDPDTIFRAGQRAADPYAVVSKVAIRLNKGEVILGLSMPSNVESYNMAPMPFMQQNLHSLEVDVTVMGDGSHVKVKVQLQDFDCSEVGPGTAGTDQHTYTEIASRRLTTASGTQSEASTPKKTGRAGGAASAPLPPLLLINIETKPPAEPYDTVVRAKLDEMKVIFAPSAKWLASLTTFVTWPEEIDYWMDLQMSAMNKLSDLNSQIEAKLEYMMKSHSAISLDVDLKAPILIISPQPTITPDSDLLVIDLGRVIMTTEQLATLEYLGQRGEMASDTASTRHDDSLLLGPQMHHRGFSLHQNTLDAELERLRHGMLDSYSDDKRSERSASIRGSRRLPGRPGSLRRPLSSNWNRMMGGGGAGDAQTVITTGEIDVRDQLFDKYQMQIHHMGVYVVKAVDQWLSLDFDNSQSNVSASIVNRFDLTADLMVSALPWDSTLPPVKICAHMPELNIRVSEEKLLRLARILPNLVQSGMTALEAGGEHLRKLESTQSKYRTADVTLMRDFDETLQQALHAEEEKDAVEPDADLRSDVDESEFQDAYDPGLLGEQSGNVRSSLRRRISVGTANESFRSFRSARARSEISDDSFESVVDYGEVVDMAETAEGLKESIRAHEAERVKLLGELRVAETQGNPSVLQQKHAQLKELDRELAQLKAEYVDLLMQIEANAQEIESLHEMQAGGQRDQARSLADLLEGMHEPAEETLEELALKRNQFIASMLRPRLNLDNTKKTRKELVHVRVNVQLLQVQLTQNESASLAGAKPFRRESIVEASSLMGFRVSGISMRLRHATAQTKMSFHVRDLDVEDAFHSHLSQKACLIATSEPSYPALSPEYTSFLRQGNADLIHLKFEVTYGQTYQQRAELITTSDRYNIRASLNHLHLSLEQTSLAQLIRTADSVITALADKVPPNSSPHATSKRVAAASSSPRVEQADATTASGATSRFTFPQLTATGRTGGFLVSLTIGHQPISTLALWGWSVSMKTQRHNLDCVVRMSDLVVYDHPAYREEEPGAVSGSGAEFAKMLSFGDGSQPMVDARVRVDLQPAGSHAPNCVAAIVRTEAMQVMVTHTHLHKIVQWFKQRDLFEQAAATSSRISELMTAAPEETPPAPQVTMKELYDQCVTALLQWRFSANLRAKSPIVYIPLSESACLPRFRDSADSPAARTGELPSTTAWPCVACALGKATAKLRCNMNGTSLLAGDGERYTGNQLYYSSDITDARVWVYSGLESAYSGGKGMGKSAPTDCHAIPLVDDWNTYFRSSLILPANADVQDIQSHTQLVVTPILVRLSNEACYTLGQVLLAQRWPDVGELEPLAHPVPNQQRPAEPSDTTSMFEGLPEIQCTAKVRLQGVGLLFSERTAPSFKGGVTSGTIALKPHDRQDSQNNFLLHDASAAGATDTRADSTPARNETNLLAITVSGIKLDAAAQVQSMLHNMGIASAPHLDLARSATVVLSFAGVDLIDYRSANLPFHHLFAKHVSLDADLSATPHAAASVPFASSSELSALAMTDPVMRVRAAFGQSGLLCQAHISNIHALVSAETLRCLYFVVRDCAESAMAAMRSTYPDEFGKLAPDSPMRPVKKFVHVEKGGVEKSSSAMGAQPKEHHREVIHPRPTSSPMAPSYSFLPSQSNSSAAPANTEPEVERALQFSPAAFTLPAWLPEIQLTVTMSSSGLWLPSDDHDPDAPALLAVASVQTDFSLGRSDDHTQGSEATLRAHVIIADLRLGFAKPRLPGFLLEAGQEPFFDAQPRADDDTVGSIAPSLNGSTAPSWRISHDMHYDARTLRTIDEQSEDSNYVALDDAQYFEIAASGRATQLGAYSAVLLPTTMKLVASMHLHPDVRSGAVAAAGGTEERKSHEPHTQAVRPIVCKVNMDIRDAEMLLYVDYRPLQWIVERTLMPLAELASPASGSASSTSPRAAAAVASGGNRLPPSAERFIGAPTSRVRIASWPEVLEHLADLVQIDCELKLDTFKLYLVNNVYQQPSAILQLKLDDGSLRVTVPTPEGRVMLASGMRAEVEYYNVTLMAWEPLVERFRVQAEVQAPVPSNVSCTVELGDAEQHEALELCCSRSDVKAVLEVMLAVTDVLNVNCTLSFIEMAANTMRLLSELGSTSQDRLREEHDLSITWLRNDTGVHVQYWTTDPSHVHDVRAHSEVPLLSEAQLGSSDLIINTAQRSRQVSFCLQRPGATPWKPIRDVPCESSTARIYWLETASHDADFADSNGSSVVSSADRRSRKLELESRLDSGEMVPVIFETANQRGVRSLALRSTMRVQNTTNVPFRIRLLSAASSRPLRSEGRHRSGWDLVWETVLPVNGILPVPIHLCAANNMYLELSPLSAHDDMSTAIIPVPSFTPQDRKIMKGQGRSGSGSAKRRKDKLVDLNAAFNPPVDRLAGRGEEYSHWLSFMPMTKHTRVPEGVELTHLTVATSVRGAPRSRQPTGQTEPGSCWLRTVTLCSPLAVANLLSERVEFRLCVRTEEDAEFDWTCRRWIESGDELQWFGCHPSEPVHISLRLPNMEWSNPVLLEACDDSDREPSVLIAELPSMNGSVLPIHLEVSDVLGRRTVQMFAPYWIISLSTLPLQFQHDPSVVVNKDLNGKDGVAAHQHYDTFLLEQMSQTAGDAESRTDQLGQLWRSRGQDGVILGPAEPIRGLPDLVPKPSHAGMAGVAFEGISRTALLSGDREGGASPRGRRTSLMSQISDVSVADSLGLTSQYNVVMVGFSQPESEMTKLRFRMEGAPWSSAVSLAASAGTHKHVQLVGKAAEEPTDPEEPVRVTSTSVFPCGISFHNAPAPFHRTKLVTIVDQFMVVNNVGRVIELRHGGQQRQQDQAHVMVLNASEAKPIFWSSTGSTHQKQFQVRLQEYGWEWSGRFKIDDHEQTEIPLRLRNEHNSTVFLMTIDVIRFESRVVISLRARPFETAPYRIENHTLDTVRLHQAGVENVGLTLLPYHSCGYAWDEPLGKHELVVDKIAPGTAPGTRTWVQDGTFSFEQLRAYETDSHIMVRVTAEGPTRVMQLVDRRSGWDEVLRPMLEEAEDEDVIDGDASALGPASLQLTVAVRGIGVSLIDGQPQELLYASMADLILEYIHNAADEVYTRCMVRRIQVDSQIWSTPFPTLFYPLEEAFEYNRQHPQPFGLRSGSDSTTTEQLDLRNLRDIAWKPFLTVEAIRGFRYPGVHFLRLLSVDVQPFDVSVEGTIIMALSRMAMQALDVLQRAQPGQTDTSAFALGEPNGLHELGRALEDGRTPTGHTSTLGDDLAEDEDILYEIRPIPFVADLMKRYDPKVIQEVLAIRGRRLYLERLVVSDIRLNLSFNPSIRHVDPELLSLAENSAIVRFILGPGAALASILNCPLRFRGLELKHLFVDEQALGVRLATHYTTQALGQAYLLLGSSEALGNPARLMSLLGQGMWDFIREPVVGLFTSPQAFGVGVVRGTSSLLTRTIASLSDSASHMSSWLASTIVAFGIADTHRISPTTSTAVVIRPRGAVSGLSQGIMGLFSEPIHGLRTAGPRGAVKGLVLGALGVFAKPTFGLLDTASKMFSTLSFRVLPQIALEQKFKMRRVRPPRYFRSPFMPLQAFKPEENAGEELLSRVQNGQYRWEGYVWHAQLTNVIVILTHKRLLVVGDQQDYCVVHWQTTFDRIVLLETASQQHDFTSPSTIGSYVVDRPGSTGDFEVQLYHLPESPAQASQQTITRSSIGKPRLTPRQAAPKAALEEFGMRLIRRVLRFEDAEQAHTFVSYILQLQRGKDDRLAIEDAQTPRSVRSASGISSAELQELLHASHMTIAERPPPISVEREEEAAFDTESLPS